MRAAWILALAACGDDRAPVEPLGDAPIDTLLPDTPTPPAGCDYAELDDPLNDITLGNGVAEATNLADAFVICGQVDPGHPLEGRVDVDAFRFALTSRRELRVELAGAITGVELEVSLLDDTNTVLERGRFLGTHVAFPTTLAAGSYRLVVTTTGATITAPIPYTLRVRDGAPTCARVTSAAAYTEQADGPQHTGNDVLAIRYATGERTLTTPNSDAPEATSLTAVADLRIAGTADDVDIDDDFRDRDTYLFETGVHDELALRVDWTGDADLDVFVFPEGGLAEIGRGTTVGKLGPERAVFPVLANTRYWLWVGAYDSSAGLPVAYDVTLCPSTFAP